MEKLNHVQRLFLLCKFASTHVLEMFDWNMYYVLRNK
jgi:hypothetical protein